MFAYDIRRFSPKQMNDTKWATEKSHESYVKNYSIVFPHDESLAGRNLHLDPLHDVRIKDNILIIYTLIFKLHYHTFFYLQLYHFMHF